MPLTKQSELISRKYLDKLGASISPSFSCWHDTEVNGATVAVLGYRRAGPEPLFLEAYLDAPIEDLASLALGRMVARDAIIEIGNLASDNALAMIELWGAAANDLGGEGEVAVATLTAPLRRMFARIGLPISVIAPARIERLETSNGTWGRYYELDPQVCVGVIADGQQAIEAFRARRTRNQAA